MSPRPLESPQSRRRIALVRRLTQRLDLPMAVLSLVFLVLVVVQIAAAAIMVLLERGHPQSSIKTFGDSLWWSAAIVTTVASDLNPVTLWGRLLAVAMMIYGMAVFGYLVSQIVAVIQESPSRRSPPPSR